MLHFIKNHGNYLISYEGEVISFKSNKTLKHSISNTGYLTVFVDGKNRLLHRLLAETFIPNPNNLPCVNHKDGNKLNNSLDNLEWCTYSHNNKHAYKTGLKTYSFTGGENSANHKLTESDVTYIRKNYKRYDKRYGATALAKRFNVTPSCITAIAHKVNWR